MQANNHCHSNVVSLSSSTSSTENFAHMLREFHDPEVLENQDVHFECVTVNVTCFLCHWGNTSPFISSLKILFLIQMPYSSFLINQVSECHIPYLSRLYFQQPVTTSQMLNQPINTKS